MKRLKLEDFKMKNLKNKSNNEEEAIQFAQLLGQVLGNCHDEPTNTGGGNVYPAPIDHDWGDEEVE